MSIGFGFYTLVIALALICLATAIAVFFTKGIWFAVFPISLSVWTVYLYVSACLATPHPTAVEVMKDYMNANAVAMIAPIAYGLARAIYCMIIYSAQKRKGIAVSVKEFEAYMGQICFLAVLTACPPGVLSIVTMAAVSA